jgi:hypothetical protein
MATVLTHPQMRNGAFMSTQPTNNQLRPELAQVVEDLIGLKALATTTGFMTFKTQREILARLSPADMAAVGRELQKRERAK